MATLRIRLLLALALIFTIQQPLAQPRPIARIGVLTLGVAPSSAFVEAFRRGMREHGYAEGRNIAYEYRFAEGKVDALPRLATELVNMKVEVVVTESTAAAVAAKQATQTLPVVMAATALDPVRLGLANSLNRPGGNVTGLLLFGTRISTKRMQLFKDTLPDRRFIAALYNAASPNAPEYLEQTRAAAMALGFEVRFVEVRSPADLDAAFQAVAQLRPDAFVTMADGMLLGQHARIVAFAAMHKLPGIYAERQFADAGALMSYGANIPANFRRAAYYVDKILKGSPPGELAIEEPPKIDFVINMKTATALGVAIPPGVLILADEVIR